jgi:hypothetical protein
MSKAPEKIWALADRRKHWQDEPPQDGQHVGHWTEYTRADTANARIAELEAALMEVTLALALANEILGPNTPEILVRKAAFNSAVATLRPKPTTGATPCSPL